MNTIRVLAAVVDLQHLTLYKEDGSTLMIPQGEPRVARIINQITPILSEKGNTGVEVDLDEGAIAATAQTYRDYEEQSGGLVKLFRVAKASLVKLFKGTNSEQEALVPNQVVGVLPQVSPNSASSVAASPVVVKTSVSSELENTHRLMSATPMLPETSSKLSAAIQEIMDNAEPVTAATFNDDNVGDRGTKEDTIVAMVGGQVIEGVEQLRAQMERANAGSAEGMNAFMVRLSEVIQERRHSVEDLLKFMKRGDLPVANDGSILIYKVLRRDTAVPGRYVDCHTGKVSQTIGSRVFMNPSLVDPNRGQDCSNGLHVARRAYLGGFSGDVIVLAKVQPEDVIAVPLYDANKMRVCAYHILSEVSDGDFERLRANQPIQDAQTLQALSDAMVGRHVGILEDVEITEHKGGGVRITKRNQGIPVHSVGDVAPVVQPQAQIEQEVHLPLDVSHDERVEARGQTVTVVDPTQVAKSVSQAKGSSRQEKAAELLATFTKARSKAAKLEAAQNLMAYKKATKVSWLSLGIELAAMEEVTNLVQAAQNQK